MEVKLLTSNNSILDMVRFAVLAALTCRGNTDKEADTRELLLRIIKAGHESILEHIYFTYSIRGISRALLQELSRHRHITLSVESTRHTLRKQLTDDYCVENLGLEPVSHQWEQALEFVGFADEHPDMPNDELKYYLPEFWPTNLILTSNVRELRHILKLRTAPDALLEFRKLGVELFSRVPDEFKFLLEDCVYVC